jgi:hypothetical protein
MNKTLYNKFIILLPSRLLQTNSIMYRNLKNGSKPAVNSEELKQWFPGYFWHFVRIFINKMRKIDYSDRQEYPLIFFYMYLSYIRFDCF